MDTNIIVSLIGLLGVGLGALLSGIGYFLKVRSDRMKTKNNVLYHLLEIRNLIKSEYVNPDELSGKYLSYCEDYFSRKGLSVDAEIPPELKSLIESHFHHLVEALRPSMDSSFVESLNDAISALAIDNPILAYQLSGRERTNDLLEVQNQYLEGLDKKSLPDETSDLIRESFSNHAVSLNYDVIEDLIREVDADIRLVSKKSGISQYFSVRKILKNTKKKEVDFDPEEFDPVMDELLTVLVDAANKSSQGTTEVAQASA